MALLGDADISRTDRCFGFLEKKRFQRFGGPRGHYFTATASNRHSTWVEEKLALSRHEISTLKPAAANGRGVVVSSNPGKKFSHFQVHLLGRTRCLWAN